MDTQITGALIAGSATLVAAFIGYYAQRKTRTTDSFSERSPDDPVQYFIAGCGVGNSIAVLPLGDEDSADQSLQEVLAALGHIGVEEGQLAPLAAAQALAQRPKRPTTLEMKIVIDDYFDAMNKLPSIVRSHSRDTDYVWFRLGELLYRIATLSIVGSPEKDGSMADRRALELLAERHELPKGLREELKEFASVTTSSEESVSLYEAANEIAQSVYALLR